MDSPQKAQALIDFLHTSGPTSAHVDAIFEELYAGDEDVRIEDRLWVLSSVLSTVRRAALGESVELVEATCQHLYDFARDNSGVQGAERITDNISQIADKLMTLSEGVRKEIGLDETSS